MGRKKNSDKLKEKLEAEENKEVEEKLEELLPESPKKETLSEINLEPVIKSEQVIEQVLEPEQVL